MPSQPFEQLVAAARAGDADAQFSIAETLEAAGRGDAAAPWLQLAAQSGSTLANAQLGVWQIIGHHVERAPAEGARRLSAAATAGNDMACAVLASLCAGGLVLPQSWDASIDWLVRAAKLGNSRALTQIALLLPPDNKSRRRLFEIAARFSNDVAQYFFGRLLLDAGDETGREWIARAAAVGNPCALRFGDLPVVGTSGATPSMAVLNTLPWAKIREQIDIASLLSVPVAEVPLATAPIATFSNVLSRELCEYVMSVASPGLQRAEVHDDNKGLRVHEMRTNCAMRFSIASTDVVIRLIEHKVAAISGLPMAHQEDMNVLRYRPGESYQPHFDFFDPDIERFRASLQARGQRVMTVLIYLNEEYESGHTEFELLDYRVRGNSGDALRFSNVDADGKPHRRMLHTGLPPSSGEKWVISKWIHDQPQVDRGYSAS